MPFPQETIDWARKKAGEIKKKYTSRPVHQAYEAYKTSEEIKYDFPTFIIKNQWGPLPHECAEWNAENCQTGASVMYVVAKELGLNPQLYGVVGLREQGAPASGFHFVVIADVKATKPLILDPRYNLFGFCTFKGNKIRIRDNNITDHTTMQFDSLIPFTEEEYCAMLEHQRSPQERISVLFDGQSLGERNTDHWLSSRFWQAHFYIKYDPEQNVLETRGVYERFTLQKRVIRLLSSIDDEGNVRERNLQFSYAKTWKWMGFGDEKQFCTLPANNVFDLYRLASKLKREESLALDALVRGAPLPTTARATERVGTLAERVKELSRTTLEHFIERASPRERAMLVAEASYQRAREGRETVHSREELCGVFEKILDEFDNRNTRDIPMMRNQWLSLANIHHTPHIWKRGRQSRKQEGKIRKRLSTIVALHKYDPHARFNAIIDRRLYVEQAKNQPPREEDFSAEELHHAYAGMLAEFIVLAVDSKKQLLLEKQVMIVREKPREALEPKVLDAIKHYLHPERVNALPETTPELETVEGTEETLAGKLVEA